MPEINHSAQIEPKITAADMEGECPEVLQDLRKRITAHYEKALKCEEKAEQNYTAMGIYLAQAQAACDDGGFTAFREKFFPELGKSRVYELLSIATNKKTIEDIRASNRERVARHRANRASASVTVTEEHHHVAEPQEILKIAAPSEAGGMGHEQAPEPEKPRRAHTPNDQPLFDFSAHVLEVLRRIDKHKPDRFAKTSIPVDDLAKLGKFLTDLAQLKKSRAKPTFVAGAVGNATISAEQSAEAMKTQHKALEEADDMAA